MTYQDTLDYLFSRLPMLQNKGTAAIKPGLERVERICEILDHPERKFKSITFEVKDLYCLLINNMHLNILH